MVSDVWRDLTGNQDSYARTKTEALGRSIKIPNEKTLRVAVNPKVLSSKSFV